jgi:hypothetical protein
MAPDRVCAGSSDSIMNRRTRSSETSDNTLAPQRASTGAPTRHDAAASTVQPESPKSPSDPTEAIDHTLQMLFSCCLMLCRASRDAEHKDDLIHSAIESLDKSIRLLRGTAAALV